MRLDARGAPRSSVTPALAITLAGALALAACAGDVPTAIAPDADGARSAILFVVPEGGTPSAFALDVQSAARVPVGDDRAGRRDLYLVYQACPLEVVGLTAGAQTLSPVPAERAVLPPPKQAHHATVDGELVSAWSPVEGASRAVTDLLARLPVREGALCRWAFPEWAEDIVTLPDSAWRSTGFALSLDPDHVLVGVSPDRADVIGVDGVERSVTITSTQSLTAAVLGRDGRVWIFADGGRAFVGDVVGGFVEVPVDPKPVETPRVAVSVTSTSAVEILAIGELGALMRFDGRGWHLVDRRNGPAAPVMDNQVTTLGLATDGTGRALGVDLARWDVVPGFLQLQGLHGPQLFEYRSGRPLTTIPVRRMTGLIGRPQPTVLEILRDFGVVVGTVDGAILADGGDGLSVLPDAHAPGAVLDVLEYDGGLLLLDSYGNVVPYRAESGVCEPLRPLTVSYVRGLLPLGDAVLVYARTSATDAPRVTGILHPGSAARRHECE